MKCVGGRTTVRCQVVRTFHCYLCEVKCNGSFFFNSNVVVVVLSRGVSLNQQKREMSMRNCAIKS